MDIQSEKLAVIQWLAGVTDSAIIRQFISLKQSNQLPSLSAAERDAIETGLQAISEGRVKTHEEVQALTRKQYPDLFK